MLKWSADPTCMNHRLWKTSRTSTGRQVLPRTQDIYKALEENHGQCHMTEDLYRWLRFLVTLSLAKGPLSVHSTTLGNQSSSTRHWKRQCLNSSCLLGPLSYFFADDMGETAKQHVLGEGASTTIFKTTPSNLGMQTHLCHLQSRLLTFSKLFSLTCQFMVVNVLWFGITNQENILAVIVGPFCHFHLLYYLRSRPVCLCQMYAATALMKSPYTNANKPTDTWEHKTRTAPLNVVRSATWDHAQQF